MKFEKKRDELIVYLDNKVVNLRGHQDSDAFTVFTESLEANSALTDDEIREIKDKIHKREDIVVR